MRNRACLSQERFGDLMGWSKHTVISRESSEFKLSLKEFERFMIVTTRSPQGGVSKKTALNKVDALLESMFPRSSLIKKPQGY
jgi:hypothetical protein